MPVTLVLGALYGDEGKGRVAHALAVEAGLTVRCSGGPNAKHVVIHEGRRIALRQVPCGALHPGVTALLGPGMLIEPFLLCEELRALGAAGVDLRRIRVSGEAKVILPLHAEQDRRVETRRGEAGVGTTGNGIGPALVDKVRRIALRMRDLGDAGRVRAFLDARAAWEGARVSLAARARLVGALARAARALVPRLVDGHALLLDALDRGEGVLVEGAQGALLDLDHGAYPHVTATHPTAGGALGALGIPPRAVERVIGVARAYATRQARGFFPTEVSGFEEGALRAATREHHLRLGWPDLVALRASHRINGFDELVVTGVDRLAGLDRIRLCRAYRAGDRRILDALPGGDAEVTPIYEDMAGFSDDLSRVTRASDLPAAARALLDRIEQEIAVPIRRFSTRRDGPLAVRRPRRAR